MLDALLQASLTDAAASQGKGMQVAKVSGFLKSCSASGMLAGHRHDRLLVQCAEAAIKVQILLLCLFRSDPLGLHLGILSEQHLPWPFALPADAALLAIV